MPRRSRSSSATATPTAPSPRPAAGRVLCEGLDGGRYVSRPVLPIAATAPPGEPTRLDPSRAQVATKLIPALAVVDDDARRGDALARWELALFQDEPFR